MSAVRDPGFVRTSLRISAGVLVWALHFAAIYGFTALACARGWSGAVLPLVVLATLAAAAAMLVIVVAGTRRRGEFESWLSASLAGLALVAVLYEGITVLVVPSCG